MFESHLNFLNIRLVIRETRNDIKSSFTAFQCQIQRPSEIFSEQGFLLCLSQEINLKLTTRTSF